ncbi:hypothetical protein EV191_1011030 [Tamaricihabitans halophyticus]|uniref:Uncharacterized protein n=1 Tax=Tamaricihabitans halophyticus TaxID=1262583 RepID=A0A4R2R5N1_9PSEU|nr:hypothetical protein [Tamaricihabitans halophyticus]TCP57078.1 hypothetical protein EV191_1011030 [Tamaricihabitans halophyticus]
MIGSKYARRVVHPGRFVVGAICQWFGILFTGAFIVAVIDQFSTASDAEDWGVALVIAVVALPLPSALLVFGTVLLRRRPLATLAWEPLVGQGPLPAEAWSELPDPLDGRPPAERHCPLPPVPVPPDALQRQIILVRTELNWLQHNNKQRHALGVGRPIAAGLLVVPALLFTILGLVMAFDGDSASSTTLNWGLSLVMLELGLVMLTATGKLIVAMTNPFRRARQLRALESQLLSKQYGRYVPPRV